MFHSSGDQEDLNATRRNDEPQTILANLFPAPRSFVCLGVFLTTGGNKSACQWPIANDLLYRIEIPGGRLLKTSTASRLGATVDQSNKSVAEVESIAAACTPQRQPQTVFAETGAGKTELNYGAVTPDYFRVLNLALIEGRLFEEDDGPNKPMMVILSKSAARKLIPDSMDPIGQRIKFSEREQRAPWLEVIGVVMDEQESSARPRIEIYRPYDQDPDPAVELIVLTKPGSQSMAERLRQEINAVDAHVTVSKVQEQSLTRSK